MQNDITLNNIRLGFACNSSSSHSMIFFSQMPSDNYVGQLFGWENFTLASKKAKLAYLYQTLVGNFYSFSYFTPAKARELLGLKIEDIKGNNEDDEYGYIDHQSLICIPKTFDEKGFEDEYIQELKEFILQPNLVILGGNDNVDEDQEHPLLKGGEQFPQRIPKDIGSGFIARKDNDYWTFFNRENGNRITFSFKKEAAPFKANAPFLVDLKITDYCPYNCSFCYMGSTISGKHADLQYLYEIIVSLHALKVFEVAIGGGEPTLNPHFADIIKQLHFNNIIANFTTKNKTWLRSLECKELSQYFKKVAFSCENREEAESVVNAFRELDIPLSKLAIQCIHGCIEPFQFEALYHYCKENKVALTLLGYKTTHRGTSHLKNNRLIPLDWIGFLKQEAKSGNYSNLCIDTVLATQFEKEILASGVPQYMFHITEGTYSMYIDAVTKKAARSSFVNPEEYSDLQSSDEDAIKTVFDSFSNHSKK